LQLKDIIKRERKEKKLFENAVKKIKEFENFFSVYLKFYKKNSLKFKKY